MSTVTKKRISPTEYLAIERAAEIKSEYFQGEMFAMTGASREHNLVGGNLFANLHNQFRDRPCEVYQGDMRVKVSPTGLYTYPDIVVVCDEPEFEDDHVDTLLNPTLIVEVLSKSTEDYDRGTKFVHYRNIESLREYVLVAQNRFHVEKFTRRDDGGWLLWETSDARDDVQLTSIGCAVALTDIYAKVQFDKPSTLDPDKKD